MQYVITSTVPKLDQTTHATLGEAGTAVILHLFDRAAAAVDDTDRDSLIADAEQVFANWRGFNTPHSHTDSDGNTHSVNMANWGPQITWDGSIGDGGSPFWTFLTSLRGYNVNLDGTDGRIQQLDATYQDQGGLEFQPMNLTTETTTGEPYWVNVYAITAIHIY